MRVTPLLALLVACWPRAAGVTPASQPMLPPPVYAAWYADVLRCAGPALPAPPLAFDCVRWRVVPGRTVRCGADPEAAGCYVPPRTILLAQPYLADGRVVRHELLHVFLGRGGHPPIFNRCGRLQ